MQQAKSTYVAEATITGVVGEPTGHGVPEIFISSATVTEMCCQSKPARNKKHAWCIAHHTTPFMLCFTLFSFALVDSPLTFYYFTSVGEIGFSTIPFMFIWSVYHSLHKSLWITDGFNNGKLGKSDAMNIRRGRWCKHDTCLSRVLWADSFRRAGLFQQVDLHRKVRSQLRIQVKIWQRSCKGVEG